MKIRPMQAGDNQAVERIIKQALEAAGLDRPGTAYFDPQIANLYDYYAQIEGAEYWVIELASGEIAGGIGIAPFIHAKGICELQKLYMADKHLGKGYSKILMDQALEFARAHYKQCYLETMTDLKIANQLYLKYGFKKLDAPLEGSDHHTMDTWFLKTFS